MLTHEYGVDPLRRVSSGVKPKDDQSNFENVVLAPGMLDERKEVRPAGPRCPPLFLLISCSCSVWQSVDDTQEREEIRLRVWLLKSAVDVPPANYYAPLNVTQTCSRLNSDLFSRSEPVLFFIVRNTAARFSSSVNQRTSRGVPMIK